MSTFVSVSKKVGAAQRQHRERAQPSNRAHLGFLEKKKDYLRRAKDYNEKRDTLKKLRKQALDKNPDEYHHHMINSHIKEDGRHIDTKTDVDEELTAVQRQLSSIKDLDYVKYKLNQEKKKIDNMKSELHFADPTGGQMSSRHTVFVDDEAEAKTFDPVKYFDTDADVVGRKFNRPRKDDLANKTVYGAVDKEAVKKVDRLRRTRYNELMKRMQRATELEVVVAKLQVKKDLARTKGSELQPIRVKKGNEKKAAVYKYIYERKR